jgi:hypothetical protein
MGISGLHEFLSSHGERRAFGKRDDAGGCSKKMVVDGPALAYYLWRTERLKEGMKNSTLGHVFQ